MGLLPNALHLGEVAEVKQTVKIRDTVLHAGSCAVPFVSPVAWCRRCLYMMWIALPQEIHMLFYLGGHLAAVLRLSATCCVLFPPDDFEYVP